MSRNKDRLGGHKPESAEAPATLSPLSFVAPTEFVELPSKGEFYPDTHPLYKQDTIEIRYMTAKDEDILTSRTLLKKGVAIDRLLENVIVNKNIKVEDLLIGDKNAIIIATRASGYGSNYEATITCPQCESKNRLVFDLSNPKMVKSELHEGLNVSSNSDGTYDVKLPLSKYIVRVRLLTGSDETYLSNHISNANEKDKSADIYTTQFKRIITSVEGHTEKQVIDSFAENMPAVDSRHIRLVNTLITPNVEIKQTLNCNNCSYSEEVEVPFGTDFFWPNQ